MPEDLPQTCWIEPDRKCPKCGSPLSTDGKTLWCGYRAGPAARTCDYGIAEVVPADREGRP